MKPTLCILLLLLSSSLCVSQRQISGEVVEIVSGDTFVLDTKSAKFSIKLQFVDAPEEGQELYETVKAHFSRFLLHKVAVVQFAFANSGVYSGRVLVGGTDLSAQMLRDGAVWYNVPEGPSQESSERAAYLGFEKLARDESRGVWNVPGLKPVYELRAERERILRERLEEQQREAAKNAAALARIGSPVLGMPLFAFDRLCPTASGDYVNISNHRGRITVYKSLKQTAERIKNKCWGDFHFDEYLRLSAINRSAFVE